MKALLRTSLALIMVCTLTFATSIPATAATGTVAASSGTIATTSSVVATKAAKTKTKTINLKKKSANVKLTAGEKLKLKLKLGKKTVKISKATFKTSKKSVATVSKKGVISAKKAGKAKITIKASKKTFKLQLTVKKKPGPVEPKRENITTPFMSTYNGLQRKITYKWSVEDLDYTASNDAPNQHLAIAALGLATNIETTLPQHKQWDLVYESLDKLGFTKNKQHAYFDGDVKDQKINCPAMVFATHKDKVKGKNVVAAVFRGSSSAQDFITDIKSQISFSVLSILTSTRDISKLEALIAKYVSDGDSTEKPVLGFYEVGVNATRELANYMRQNGFSKDNTTVFITGHSLGAATASLVGLRAANSLVNPNSVFCYPFATPNYFKGVEQNLDSIRMTGKDMKMFSFDNEEDIVPDVPLGLSYYKTSKRVNFDREWIQVNDPARYRLFNEIYTYFRGRSYENDTGNYMPAEYSFALFSELGIEVNHTMVRNHMPYTYMALLLSELPADEARKYITG